MLKIIYAFIFFLKISLEHPTNSQQRAAYQGPTLQTESWLAGEACWDTSHDANIVKSMPPPHCCNVILCLFAGCAIHVVFILSQKQIYY